LYKVKNNKRVAVNEEKVSNKLLHRTI